MSNLGITVRMSANLFSVTHDGTSFLIENDKERDRASSIIINEMQKAGRFNTTKKPSSDHMVL